MANCWANKRTGWQKEKGNGNVRPCRHLMNPNYVAPRPVRGKEANRNSCRVAGADAVVVAVATPVNGICIFPHIQVDFIITASGGAPLTPVLVVWRRTCANNVITAHNASPQPRTPPTCAARRPAQPSQPCHPLGVVRSSAYK